MELLQAYGSDEESVEHERSDKTPPISPAHKPPPCSREPLPKRINSHASSSRLDSVQTTGGLIVDISSSHNVYFQKTDGAPVSVDLDSRPSDFSRGLNHHDDIAAASPYCFFDNRAGPPLPPPLYAQPLLPLYDPFAYMPSQSFYASLFVLPISIIPRAFVLWSISTPTPMSECCRASRIFSAKPMRRSLRWYNKKTTRL